MDDVIHSEKVKVYAPNDAVMFNTEDGNIFRNMTVLVVKEQIIL